jgi:protein O-GlcNAc transferase
MQAAFNAGNQAWRDQQFSQALAHYSQAAELEPTLALAQLGRARCLVALGEWMAAREAFAACLRLEPGHYSAWLEAGHLCRQMGELRQAAAAYQRAIDAAPERYEAPLGMARVLEQLGEPATAEQAYAHAQRAAAGSASPERAGLQRLREVQHHMARYRLERGDSAGAGQALQAALATAQREAADANEVAELHTDLGEVLLRQGRREAALQVLSLASAAKQERTLARLAALSFRHNLWQEALAVLQRNVELHPHSQDALWNLAHLLAECWQMDEAEAMLQRAEALGPVAGALSMRASVAGRQGDADTALSLYQRLAQQGQGHASSAAMSALYSDQLSPQAVAALHRELFAPLGQGARAAARFVRPPLAGRRLKLGLVSADFHHQHPVNLFMQPVLRELDRSRFELFVYFTGVSYDEQTQLARSRTEHWVEATTLNDLQLAKRMDADQIDLLLDLAGHTGQQRMSLFAKRAAPVQATYLGYPGSTGVPNVDWLLGDAVVTPPEDDALCSEQVARLPGLVFCYAPETAYPEPDWDAPQFLARPLTLGSFNNVPKLTPRTLALWARVLEAVPNSRLVLKAPSFGDAGAVRAFSQRLQALGVDLGRVEFRGPVGLDAMMAEYADIDIALDPLPYNGGTTSLQALWMGVPVLTLQGKHFVSRMGASFMRAAGLPEWVAQDEAQYVALAQRMAADRPALLALKRGLRQRQQALPAWDPVAHTRAMEKVFIQCCQP